MSTFKSLLIVITTFIISYSSYASTRSISIIDGSSRASFGESVKLTLELNDWFTGSIRWKPSEDFPPGFQLRPLGGERAEVTGRILFEGQWCVSVLALVTDQPTGIGVICFVGDRNDQYHYPRLANAESMLSFYGNRYSTEVVELDPESLIGPSGVKRVSVQKVFGSLPYGINTHVQLEKNRIVFEGQAVGNYHTSEVIFKLTGENAQTPLYVKLMNYVSDFTGCPDGQEYDYMTRTCRTVRDPVCPTGYFYNSISQRCELLSGPCPPRFYLDPVTNSCKPLPRN